MRGCRVVLLDEVESLDEESLRDGMDVERRSLVDERLRSRFGVLLLFGERSVILEEGVDNAS